MSSEIEAKSRPGRRRARWLARLASDRPGERARAAAVLLARVRRGDDTELVTELAARLRDRDAGLRARVCELLAEAPEPLRDLGPVLRTLADPDSGIRRCAVLALVRHGVGRPGVVFALLARGRDADPRVRAAVHGALATLAPAPASVRVAGDALVTDRDGSAADVRAALRGAGETTVLATAPLLDERDGQAQRAALEIIRSVELLPPSLLQLVARLVRAGVDTYVRRAAARALGCAGPSRVAFDALRSVVGDWDPALRAAAALSLSRLGAHLPDARPLARASIEQLAVDEPAELANALRAGRAPRIIAPTLITALGATEGYARLDLADALLAPHRAREPVRGVWVDGIDLPFARGGRIDDALERLSPSERGRAAAGLLAATAQPAPDVRASCAVFASRVDPGLATALVLQQLHDDDPVPAVRVLAGRLLAGLGARDDGGTP